MNNLDRLNEKLRNRERVFGYTIYLPSTYVMDDYMPAGVDYVLFDCEHGLNDEDHYSAFYRHFRERNIPTITRISDAEYHLAARAADCGSDGIMVPRVETLEQVKKVVDALYLPPIGKKGYGKMMFYPNETIEEYNKRRLLWIQIESPAGADALPEILEKYGKYISACVIGPCDLSINAGTPLDFYSEASLNVIEKVYKLCAEYGISSGSYCFDEADAAKRAQLGTNLFWVACDAIFMARGIKQTAEAIAQL